MCTAGRPSQPARAKEKQTAQLQTAGGQHCLALIQRPRGGAGKTKKTYCGSLARVYPASALPPHEWNHGPTRLSHPWACTGAQCVVACRLGSVRSSMHARVSSLGTCAFCFSSSGSELVISFVVAYCSSESEKSTHASSFAARTDFF